MSHLDALEQDLRDLKLTRLADQLQGFLASAAKQEWDYGTFLGNVVKEELAARRDRRTEMATRMARLPFVKTIENFDFAYQPSINAKQFKELSAVRWIANGENLILLGPPGVGKTHLAVALGIKAIEQAVQELGGKKPTRAQVSAAVRKIKDFKGITGSITFDGKGDPVKTKYFVLKFETKRYPGKVVKTVEHEAPQVKKP